MIPTANELALLRSQPHRTKLHLSIYRPNTVLSAQVNDGSIAKGERIITYDGGAGTWQDIKRGMTMHVGTSAGGKDKGSVYVKSATSTTITVGENSHINWEDDDYLTVIDFFQIWPLYPRYTQDEENITVYKDYDEAYTNQNEILGSFICMGPHHAGFLDGGSHDVYFSASGTSHVGGDTLSYHWLFPDGTPTGSSVHTPGNISYGAAGHYTASLTVSGSSGSVDTSYRHISIYDRPEEGTNVPVLSWGIDLLTGERSSGGYTARLWVKEDISTIEDGALVVIFADDWYGTTQQSIGGNALNRSNTVFVGYILDDTIDYDYQTSTVRFDVGSPTETMKLVEAFSVSVQDSTNPSADAVDKGGDPWFYLVGLTMETALFHYIRWHTTVGLCADLEYTATAQAIQYFDADRSSVYDAVNSLMSSTVLGATVSDRQGKVFFDDEAEAVANALTSIPVSITMNNGDWIGTPAIIERTSRGLAYLEVGGVKWDGAAADTFTPFLLAAPGEVPAYRGSQQRISGMAFSSLAQSKALAGNLYANRNSQFPRVTLNIAGNYRNLDLAPLEAVQLNVTADETFRGITWTNKPFSVARLEWLYDAGEQYLRPNLTVTEITEGFDADDLEIPEQPPTEGYDQPGILIPPLPIWPTPVSNVNVINSIWVPAIGGDYNTTDPLVYGGGPYCGGASIDHNQQGISFNSALDRTLSVGMGSFISPDWVTNVTIYTVWKSTDTTLSYESDILAWSMPDGAFKSNIFAYISETIAPASGYDVGTGFDTAEWDSVFPGNDIFYTIRARGDSTGAGCVWLLGWYVVFS